MTVRIDVFTIFPEYVEGPLGASLLGRARERGLLDLRVHDLRDWTDDRHRSVDDTPFGGGAGMVLTPGPVFAAVEAVEPPRPLLLCAAAGRRFDQAMARELASGPGFSLLCGRYEGVDQRVIDRHVTLEISLGDYVLSGGELAALVLLDAIARLQAGVLTPASRQQDSFSDGLLEGPSYTRPEVLADGTPVPEVLLSGHHGRIERWRRERSLEWTAKRRPDLIEQARVAGWLDALDEAFLRRVAL